MVSFFGSKAGVILLEEEMATHSSILAWKIPWTEEPGRLQSMGWQRVRQDLATNTHTHNLNSPARHQTHTLCIGRHNPHLWSIREIPSF